MAELPSILLRGVDKEYRRDEFRIPVLVNLDLAVDAGESFALVGRSGAGKSTVLKLINRLLLPQGGAVVVEGRDTREWDPITLRRRIGYVLQEIGLFPHLTVEDNVGSGFGGAVLEALAENLHSRGGFDLDEAFIDGSFAPAKKGASAWARPSAARGPR